MSESNGGVRVVVYKKILDGDIGKMQEKSNITQSGGGARDFRFNPEVDFRPIFIKMFPNEVKPGTLMGKLYWSDASPTEAKIDIRTDKVRKEVRLCKVSKCLHHMPLSADDWIFIMVLDDQGRVWPYFITEESLLNDDWNPLVASEILKGLRAKRPKNQAAAGYIDFDTGKIFTNGEVN